MASAVFSYRSVRVCTIVMQAVCRGVYGTAVPKRLKTMITFNQKLSNDSILRTERQDRVAGKIQSGWKGVALAEMCKRCLDQVYRHDSVIVQRSPIPSSVQKTKRFIWAGGTSGQGLHPFLLAQDPNIYFAGSAPDSDTNFDVAASHRLEENVFHCHHLPVYIRMCVIVLQAGPFAEV
jgi:hypothetical protein